MKFTGETLKRSLREFRGMNSFLKHTKQTTSNKDCLSELLTQKAFKKNESKEFENSRATRLLSHKEVKKLAEAFEERDTQTGCV